MQVEVKRLAQPAPLKVEREFPAWCSLVAWGLGERGKENGVESMEGVGEEVF